MGSWDEEHRLRLRAERALVLLRQLWGDQPPPGPHAELLALVDAIAGDDERGQREHLVCQPDGLTYETLAHLLQLARSPQPSAAALDRAEAALTGPDPDAALPPALLTRLHALGLLDDPVPHRPGGAPGTAPASTPRVPPGTPGPRPDSASTVIGVWELDPATGVVAFDDIAAQLIGAGTTADSAPVDDHLKNLIHPDDSPAVAAGLQQCLTSGAPFLKRFRAHSPDGEVTWLISQARVIHHPADASPRLTGFVTLDPDSARAARPEAVHRH